MLNLSDTINNRQQEELKLLFNGIYYNISALSNKNFNIQKKVIFFIVKMKLYLIFNIILIPDFH